VREYVPQPDKPPAASGYDELIEVGHKCDDLCIGVATQLRITIEEVVAERRDFGAVYSEHGESACEVLEQIAMTDLRDEPSEQRDAFGVQRTRSRALMGSGRHVST
jgi:hypothetical protein